MGVCYPRCDHPQQAMHTQSRERHPCPEPNELHSHPPVPSGGALGQDTGAAAVGQASGRSFLVARLHRSTDETFPGAVKPSSPSRQETEDLPLEGCEALPTGCRAVRSHSSRVSVAGCSLEPCPPHSPRRQPFKDTAPSSFENSRSLGLLELARVGERLLRAAKRVPLVAEELRVNALGGHVLVADGLLDACASEATTQGRSTRTAQQRSDAASGC